MSFKETELGKIPSDWKVKSISECLYIKGRIGWKGLKKSEYIEKSDYRIINGSALDGKNIDWNKCGYISEERYEESPEIMLKKNDIVMTKDGTIGKVAIIKELESKTTVASGLFVIRVIREDVSYKYLYYYFVSRYFKELVKSRIEGSVIPHLYQRDLVELKIPMPMIEEQKAIAKILSDLDEKIEVNNKINKNLEEMAQAIFKQWFVDFEFPNEEGKPYKSSGGEMVESELGMIPKTFSISTLGNEVKTIDNRGKTPPLEKEKTEYPIIDVKVLAGSSRIINYNNCLKFVNEETYKNWFRSGHPLEKDILISTVGSLAELKMFFGHKGCIAQNVVALRSINISSFYMYEYLKYIKPKLVSYNIGSVQPSIKITHIMKHNIIIPEKNIVLKYDNLIKSIIEKIYNNENENERLEKLRDTLLPKLMSGEIRVPLENSEN